MKKKILFLLPNLNYGGAEKVTLNFFNYLDKKKYYKKILIQNRKGPLEKKIINKKNIIYFSSKRFILFSFALIKYLKKNKFDYVYSTLSHISLFLLFIKLLGFLKSKLIIRESNFVKKIINSSKIKYFLIFYYKFFYKNIDYVIASSKTIKKDIIKNTKISQKKIVVIYNPVEKIFYKKKSILKTSKKTIKLLSIGRLSAQKNYTDLLLFLSRESRFKWQLKIIGDGIEKKKILMLRKKLNLTSKVKLIPKSSKIWNEISQCDFYVNSSKWEGMPNAVIESLIMKKRVFFLNKIEVYYELKKIFPNQIFSLKENYDLSKSFFYKKINNNNNKIKSFKIKNSINEFQKILV